MTTFARRQRRPFKSERHLALSDDESSNSYRISASDLTTELGLGSKIAGTAIAAVLVFAVCIVCWVLASGAPV